MEPIDEIVWLYVLDTKWQTLHIQIENKNKYRRQKINKQVGRRSHNSIENEY